MAFHPERFTLTTAPDLAVEEVIDLYESVGWSAYTCRPEIFPRMIAAASHIVAAHDGNGLVGLARVVGDGVSIAVIQDLIVHPAHQRQGLGTQLLQRVLECTHGIRQTFITTDAAPDNRKVVRLYERQGFRRCPDEGLVTLTLLR